MFYEVFIFEHNLSNLRLYCTSANTHCSHCYATKYATYLILMFLSVPASSAGAYWWCVYLPLEHFALWVKPTFHIFTENFRLVGSPYFWSQKKIYQNFRISFEYVPIFRKNPSKSLKTER